MIINIFDLIIQLVAIFFIGTIIGDKLWEEFLNGGFK